MPGARESMWADGRGRYYDVVHSGHQRFAVRTSDEAGRVVRFTKHLIRREPLTGIFLWQGAHRTFELDARGAPDHLLWQCRAGGRSFTWTPTSPMNEGRWPYPLHVERADMHEEHRGVKNQEAPPLSSTTARPNAARRLSSDLLARNGCNARSTPTELARQRRPQTYV